MLGICCNSFLGYFHTVTHYSAHRLQNQPLFSKNFQKFSGAASGHPVDNREFPDLAPRCQDLIFAQRSGFRENYRSQKNGNSVEGCRNRLCQSNSVYPQPACAVDNPCGQTCGQCGKLRVINRYSGCFHFVHICANLCIQLCITAADGGFAACYVTGFLFALLRRKP